MSQSKPPIPMPSVTRREALRWLLASGSAVGAAVLTGCDLLEGTSGAPPGSTGRIAVTTGCYSSSYAGAGRNQLGCGLVSSFGNPQIDRQFVEEIGIQAGFWRGVPARVHAFDECYPVTNAISLASGHILIGYWITQRILHEFNTSLPAAGLLAHEWAHQVQFRFGYIDSSDPTVRRAELEADAFSGFFMGLAKGWAGSQLESYLGWLESMGDTQFNHPNHHGTAAERRAAGTLGMNVAFGVIESGKGLSYDELHGLFASEIASLLLGHAAPSGLGLSPAATAVSAVLDRALVRGVLEGSRSVEELTAPATTLEQRMPFFPS